MKKLLSVLLVVLMLVGMLPINALHTHAAEANETISFASTAQRVSQTTAQQVWKNGCITFTNDKAKSSSNVANYSNPVRLYASSSVTIACADGNITKIVVTANNSTYANALKNSTYTDATATVSGSTVTITPKTSTQSSCTISSLSAQVRLNSLTVYYEAASSCEHTNTTENSDGYAATCTEAGKTNSVVCADCGEVVTAQQDISALGHNYVNGVCQNCQNKLPTVSFSVPSQVEAVDRIIANESGSVTLPEADDYTGKYEYTFVGWATQSVSDTESKPATLYAAGAQYSPANDITLYAVYTYGVAGSGGSTEYVLTEASKIKAGDTVVITTTKNNSTYYAMSNNNGTSSAPKATEVTVANGKLSDSPADTLKWDVGGSAGQYIFYISGDTDALYCTSTNNGVRVGTNTANTFKIDASTGYLVHNGTGRYIGIYNNADWRCYTSVNNNIAGQTLCFFVKSSGGSATYYTSTLEALDTECQHTNTTETTVDATCTAAGSTTVTCNDCGAVISETEIPATGHTTVVDAGKEPTCVDTGLTEGSHCSVCNAVLVAQETIPATGEHNFVGGICSVCGEQKSAKQWQLVKDVASLAAGDKIVIVAEGAEFALGAEQANNNRPQAAVVKNDEVVTFDDTLVQVITLEAGNVSGTFAFLTNEGYLYAASSSSNYLRSKTTLDDNGSWLITIAADGVATIKAQGSNTRNWLRYNSTSSIFSCYGSGQGDVLIYKETIVCEHENVVDVAKVPATCTTVGYTAGKQCTECGAYTEGHEEIAARGHSYDNGVVTTAPGCTTTGVMTYTCSVCKHEKTNPISATGHVNTTTTTVDATCTVAGSVTVTCDACGAVISSTPIPAGHSWDEGKVTTEATCEKAGVKTYTCSVCKETKTEEISAIGHIWDEGKVTTAATCDAAGVKTFTCQNDSSHTKTEEIAPLGHSYDSEGICENCGAEVSHYELVTDYTKILAGGEFVLAIKSGDTFYALNNDATSNPTTFDLTDDLTGEGADMMVIWSEDIPVWQVDYYPYRTNCFSLYSSEQKEYLAATDDSSFASSSSAWAWTFIDSNSSVESDGDGIYAVEQSDGSVAFVVASASIIDRAISLKSTSQFANYSVRDPRNREVYFFKMVKSGTTEHTVTFVENGQTVSTVGVDVDDNVIELPEYSGTTNMPNGYTDFLGWVTLPHTESLIAPTTIYGAGDTFYVTEDTKLYALYTREDTDAEGQAMSYQRVTNNNQLVQDQMYIIVGYNEKTDTYYAMSKDQLSGDRGASVVVPDSNDVITFAPADNVAVLKLTQGYEIGSFAFLDVAMNKFLYCASTTSENALKSETELSADSSFVITINNDENGIYSIMIAQSTDTNRTNLAYNTVSDDTGTFIFSCYDPSITSVDLQQTFLYVGVPNTTVATYYTTGLCDHQWEETEKVEATCEHAGYTIETCSVCGEVRVTDTKAHGHNVGTTSVTTEPTCTTTGVATSYCTACNKEFTEILPVIPHAEVVDAAVAASCTETGLTEGKHCSVCDTVLVPQQVAPALGHDYDAEKGKVVTSSNGYYVVVYPCVRECGAEHEAAQLRFTNASLTLENNIVVNFKTSEKVAGDGTYAGFTDLCAVFTYGERTGNNAVSAEGVALGDGRYNLACRRVTPSQIGDEITATLYGTYDGKEYSFEMKYSAAEYCYAMLKETTDTKLQTLLVDLLYYCDAARAYTTYQGVDEEYKYYGSVTEDLTDAQKKYRTVSDEFTSVMGLSGEGEFAATWQSASLILGEATSIRFRVDLEGYDIGAVTVKAIVGGKDYTDISVKQDGETYLIQIDGISAHRMRETVEVTLYSGETVISKTVSYSIESYVANKMGDTNEKLVNMLIAMMSYGDAAVAYKG